MFSKHERNRLIAMTFVMFVILVLVGRLLFQKRSSSDPASQAIVAAPEAPPESVVLTPEIDRRKLDLVTSDQTREERVLLETEALDYALSVTRVLREPHFEALGVQPLREDTIRDLVTDPSRFRGSAYRVYGWVDSHRRREVADERSSHYILGLRLERGGRVYAVVPTERQRLLETDDFVRIDGIFLKVFNEESGDGWVEAPLLVGPRAVHSYPELPPVVELAPETFRFVKDDSSSDISGMPFEERWELLAYARDHASGSIDWNAAPILTQEVLDEIYHSGAEWRGRPVLLPLSEVMGMWDQDAGENPARLNKVAHGWIGSWDWRGKVKLIQFQAPFATGDIAQRDQVRGRGFFLKNLAYEPRDGPMTVAPFFVLESLEIVPRTESDAIGPIVIGIATLLMLVGVFVGVSVFQDRKRSRALQTELVRRRRARQQQASPS